jgi:hypothetical protein
MAVAAVCFDAGLPPLSRPFRAALIVFVVVTALIATPVAQKDLNKRFTNADLLAQQLTAEAEPHDFLVVTPWYCGVSFKHYYRGATPWTTLPPLADYATHRYDLVKMQMQNTNAIQPVLRQIAATLQAGNRVWVAADEGWMDVPEPGTPPPPNLPPPPLKSTGWSDLPYVLAWTSQVAHFLANHSRQFAYTAPLATDNVRAGEHLNLFVASGWQNPVKGLASTNPPPERP